MHLSFKIYIYYFYLMYYNLVELNWGDFYLQSGQTLLEHTRWDIHWWYSSQ